jgi:type IV secretion system protein VirD4
MRKWLGFIRRALLPLATGLTLWAVTSVAWAQYYSGYGGTSTSKTELVFERIGILLLAAFVGALVGVASLPKLKPFRSALWAIIGGIAVLYSIFGPAPQADMLNYIAAFIVFIAVVVIIRRINTETKTAELDAKRPTTLGSAQWADLDHLIKNGIVGTDGFILGSFVPRNGLNAYPLQYKGVRHLLTVAPTRSGKGVSSIIPNLLTYPGSVFVIDPKGENALITANRRGNGTDTIPGMKQDVVLLDPWDVAATKLGIKPAAFNPLDWIKADDPDAAENAFLLADALVMSEAKDEGRFWDEEAKALLMGIILYVATAEDEKETRTLGRIRDLLTQDDEAFKAILTKMFNHPHPIVRSTAARQAAKDEKLFSSVLASAQSHTHFLDSGRIRKSLSRSDFSFGDLKTKPTSIYLILPADRLRTFDRWLRLLIQQAITVNARNIDQKPERPILFLLDEMPTLGRLPAIEQAYSLMAGFGMQLWGIVQDLSQLAQVYGPNGWQTFISNSGVIQYFGSRDKMTAEYFSSLCGVTTVAVHNFSLSIGRAIGTTSGSGPGGASSSHSDTSNWSKTGAVNEGQRQLAYPDELMVMKAHQQIVFVENLDPISAHKVLWYKDAKLKKLGVNLQPEPEKEPEPEAPTEPETTLPEQAPAEPVIPELPFKNASEMFRTVLSLIEKKDYVALKAFGLQTWKHVSAAVANGIANMKHNIGKSGTP